MDSRNREKTEEKIRKTGVVPVIALEHAEDAAPLAEALLTGGLPCAEVTFRTDAAEETIAIMSDRYPEILTGAGTVLTIEQVDRAVGAGAKFIVAPGFDPEIVDYCLASDIPVFPGIVTPSELAQAIKRGLEIVKFFPAEPYGGLKTIMALAAPYTSVSFMPTGGINASNLRAYLDYNRIAACGGSWMVGKDLIANGDFNRIRDLCREAAEIVREIRG